MNEKIIEELEILFEFVPPEKLRQQITFVYFYYLQGDAIKTETQKKFTKKAGDFYFLIRFLELAEKYRSKK